MIRATALLAVICFLMAVSSLSPPVAAFVSTDSIIIEPECEGNACPVVTVTWENEGQRFSVKNDSDRPVKVEVSTFAGTSSVSVPPRKTGYLCPVYRSQWQHA